MFSSFAANQIRISSVSTNYASNNGHPVVIHIDEESEEEVQQQLLEDNSVEEIEVIEIDRSELKRSLSIPSTAPKPVINKLQKKESCAQEIKALSLQIAAAKELKRHACNNQSSKSDPLNMIQEFISQDLMILDQIDINDNVLVGQQYQATIKPLSRQQRYCVPNPSSIMIWSSKNGFDLSVFQQFREMFGEKRTSEQLCHLYAKCNSNWQLMPQIMQYYRRDLKKVYIDMDLRI